MGRLIVILVLLSGRAWAGELVLAGRIDRVVTAGELIAVVREGEVRVLADGRTVLRLAPDGEAVEGGRGDRWVEDALEEHDIPEEERDSEYAEAVIDDESTLRGSRKEHEHEHEHERGSSAVVAGSGDEIWIAAGRRLWRVDPDGPRRVATLPRRFDQLAVGADGRLMAASGAQVFLSRDEGMTFDRLTDAEGPVLALAAGEGFLAWATAGQLTRVEIGRVVNQPLASARDLRACGPHLLALEARGVLVVDAGGTRALAAGRDARRLACAGGTWVLVGRHLLVSRDEGRSFSPRADLPPAVPLDAAVGPRGLLVATDVGLYGLPVHDGAPALAPSRIVMPLPRPRWAPYLPRLTVAAAATLGPGGEDVRAVATADFPLAPPRPPLPGRRLAQVEPEPAPVQWRPDREATCLPIVRDHAVARALVEPERARSYVSRAGHAAWLPELRLLMNRRLGRSESLDVPSGASVGSGPLGLDTANDVRYEARATWDLSKLVFSAEEIAAVNAALRMADLRREVESLANRLYFERRRLKMEPIPTADTRARRDLRVEELDAELDALSGGAFTRCLAAPP
jgi:hypothetical protein